MMNRTSPFKSAGFTLIELIVALALGLTMVSGTIVIFVQNNRSALQDEEISRVLENGRYAIRSLGRELAMSGFWGKFLDIDTVTEHASVAVGQDCGDGAGPLWVMELDPLELLSNVTVASVAANFECLPSADIQVGTDIFAIKRVADGETADAALVNNQMYLRTNGVSAEMFRGGGLGTPPILTGTETNWAYMPQVYYIRDYSLDPADGIPSLCRAYLDTSAPPDMTNECLVEGIENLQIEFGIDSDEDFVANYFVSAPTAAELSDAVAARLYVLVRSVNALPEYLNDKTYNLGTTVVAAANDAFYRRVFSTTVVLRNPANLTGLGS